ncbi:hypothetical protein CU098_007007 [Rhizopus stolonifer]|uniref:MAP3K12-binding inhibitory protein 1 n=1 Tax=Rhizopus stolonifer TaxID=4846 RepID=A0A367JNY4_RHIST|nr:hypothetical protein CU098_007007 [Rhizopus stolonifer]
MPTESWDKQLSAFFKCIGLVETSECLESELVVLSHEQLEKLPDALESLVERLLESLEKHVDAKEQVVDKPEKIHEDLLVTKRKRPKDAQEREKVLEEEEKERTKRLNSEQIQIRATSSEVEQRINTFIQVKRNELDESNRTEFLSRHDPTADDITCARTDAREINRNIQMKFDIVNNEDGPLARSLQTFHDLKANAVPSDKNIQTGADATERLQNIQDHLNVKIDSIAEPPFSLFERIKILENTLMDIERRYPKWAAVHFNQPNRAFPPPPPVTYITRPPEQENGYASTQINTAPPQQRSLKAHGRANSSLTRAVIDQLNRQVPFTIEPHP